MATVYLKFVFCILVKTVLNNGAKILILQFYIFRLIHNDSKEGNIMNVTFSNVNFLGQLRLKNPKLWTPKMKKAISENEYIQKALLNKDVIGNITTSVEKKSSDFAARHVIGDTLYKVSFEVQDENVSILDKLFNKTASKVKKYAINRHFHSEHTTVERIKRFKF